MTKRFRNEDGSLIMTIDQIAEATEQEGREYYKAGEIFLFCEDGREYVHNSEPDEPLIHFQSFDGYNLFIPTNRLGTFLPDVATDGMELIRQE